MSPGHRPDCDCAECQRVYDEVFADRETACPTCKEPVDAHWSLSMSVDELHEWDKNDRVCAWTREEVALRLEMTMTEGEVCD